MNQVDTKKVNYNKEYYLKNRETIRKRSKEYYEKHKIVKEYPDLEGEVWKPLVGYEGYYLVSNLGRVKSLWNRRERIICGCLDQDGYIKMTLTNPDRSQTTYRRARLIAETWIPNEMNKPEIDHINTVRTDDRVLNLRWATSIENKRNPSTRTNRLLVDYGFNRGKHRVWNNEHTSFRMI